MAFQNILQSAKKFFGPDNTFFHGTQDRYESQQPQEVQQPPMQDLNVPQMNPQQQYEQQFMPPQGYQHPYTQQPQQQMQPQQMEYQQQYQQPQPVQQEMTQPYQQGYRPAQQQTVNEPYVAPRNRRSAQHQQPQQPAQPQQPPMQQMPQDQGNVVNFPNNAPQQPNQQQKLPSTCVINTRSMADCRNAIGILRAGDCVIAVMDTITDQVELRRYVDTLNGACFSLGCTMTRLASRVGVYLLAPTGVKVYTDNATTQMNGAARPQQPKQRPAMQQPFQTTPFQQPQQSFAPPQSQQQMEYQQPSPYQQMQYQQPQQFQSQPQQYQQQSPAQGYAPDASEAEYNAM